MTGKRLTMILPAIAFTLVLIFAGQPAQADWGISFQGEVGRSYNSYSGDRLTSEYRRGYQVDDWVERGASSVTDSPLFDDGLRLAAWATGYEDDYEYGMASAIYFFEVPSRSRSLRIKISYDGEANRSDIGDEIAARVWIRRATIGDDYEEYYPSEGRYEDVDQPLYGDTFVLRARKRLEILRLSTSDYVDDGMMELHIVAEGRQRIDVKYIEVETYSYAPKVRVITRYYKDYTWQPWNQYAYWYFYTGPTYHFGDYYYVRYTYPHYYDNYIGIRFSFNNYLTGYYGRYPNYRHVHWANVPRVSRGTRRTWGRGRLDRWTSSHSEARRGYVVTSAKRRSPVEVRKSRTRVRGVLSSSSRRSPSAVRTQPGKVVRSPARRGTASTQTRSPSITDVKKRVTTPNVRRGTARPSSSTTAPVRSGTQSSSTKSRRVESKAPVRTQSSPPASRRIGPERKSRVTTRTAPQQKRTPPSSKQIKTKRDSISSRRSETKRTEPQRKAPERKAPERKVESKKQEKDDDDDDDKKRTTPSTRKSTIKTRKTR